MVIAADLARALDPVLLAEAAGLDPDPWQADVLRSASRRILLNCSRQSGKSTTVALLGLHVALYEPSSLVLLLSPSLRQSAELFRKVAGLYTALGAPVPSAAESALRLELDNGSRIVSLPGTEATIRGYSGVRLLLVDEASRVDDELYYALRPMLAVSGGSLIALSTPWGRRGWWHREWTEGGPTWERVQVTAEQCPRIASAFLEEERRSLGPLRFASEYDCQFVETEQSVFSYDEIQAALSDKVLPLFPVRVA
jgi:hypothetical protein